MGEKNEEVEVLPAIDGCVLLWESGASDHQGQRYATHQDHQIEV